jgi:ubiquinone/menaquinone biosynthesis C-methylase UbiE
MAEDSFHGRKEVVDGYRSRELASKCPPLIPYLRPGAAVLDVGCSVGAMTVEVAQIVHPGPVVGVDIVESAIAEARDLVEKGRIDNVTFQVGDTYHLDFEDQTFDVVYSLALLVWLHDPIRALKEQKRVTKRGGWVAASTGDYGTMVVYPPCPAFEKFIAALHHLNDPADTKVFANLDMGREALAVFSEAGFEDIRLEGYVARAEQPYVGSDHFEQRCQMWRSLLDTYGPSAPAIDKLVRLGVLNRETILAAQNEIEMWHDHPHAFQMSATVFAAGRVP